MINQIKVGLLKLLLLVGLKTSGCGINKFKQTRFFISNDYKAYVRNSRFEKNSKFHVVVHNKGLDEHVYSADPREPYEVKNYGSVDEYILSVLTVAISARDAQAAVSTREVVSAKIASCNQSLTQEERIQKMMEFSEVVKNIRSNLDSKSEEEAAKFLNTLFYKVMIRFI